MGFESRQDKPKPALIEQRRFQTILERCESLKRDSFEDLDRGFRWLDYLIVAFESRCHQIDRELAGVNNFDKEQKTKLRRIRGEMQKRMKRLIVLNQEQIANHLDEFIDRHQEFRQEHPLAEGQTVFQRIRIVLSLQTYLRSFGRFVSELKERYTFSALAEEKVAAEREKLQNSIRKIEEEDKAWIELERKKIRSQELSKWDFFEKLQALNKAGDIDAYVATIFGTENQPDQEKRGERTQEMVHYQPTMMPVVLRMIERLNLSKEDVFYDLGSGLGGLAMITQLTSGARVKGIEFEPAYAKFAQARAQDLNIPVEFINSDVRDADFSDGTVFFLFNLRG